MIIQYQEQCISNEIAGEKTISAVLSSIKKTTQYHDLINKARKSGKNSIQYEEIKKEKLPAFLFNFTHDTTNYVSDIISPTGFMYLDIDNIYQLTIEQLKQELIAQLPMLYAYWRSLSTNGLSLLIRVDGMTPGNYHAFKEYIKAKFGHFRWDANCFKANQKCVLSHDPNIYVNEQCQILTWSAVQDYFLANNKSRVLRSTNNFSKIKPEKKYVAKKNNAPYKFNDAQKYLTNDEAYAVFPDGVDTNKLWIPERINIGERNRTLSMLSTKWIAINGENYDGLISFLYDLKARCEESEKIKDTDLISIAKNTLKNYTKYKFKMHKRKIIFNENTDFTMQEKWQIVGKENGAIRRNNTLNDLLSLYLPEMTQNELIQLSGMSRSTIKRYWNQIKEKFAATVDVKVVRMDVKKVAEIAA